MSALADLPASIRFKGIALVPGIAHGVLWAPKAEPADAGDLRTFRRVRARFIEQAASLPADLRQMYEALALDPMWDDGISQRLGSGLSLPEAINQTAAVGARELAVLDDPYLAARSADLLQLGAGFARLLGGKSATPPDGAIVCARDVSAVELQNWAPDISGVVLIDVPLTAHLAIVARSLGLPTAALSGESAGQAFAAAVNGDATGALLNGFGGWLETAPGDALLRANPPQRVIAEPDPDPVVIGGRHIGVLANIAAPSEAALGAILGADGIGLLRTEFLYIDRAEPPSLEEESAAYRRIAAAFADRPIVVRTLDLGGDKVGAGFAADGADHGMLGIRGIRLTLRHPELFARHLRAIVEGFAGSDLRIMFPMVAVPEEFARGRDAVRAAVRAADSARVPQLGLMLEIPAAAYALDEFARDGASFMSLGTNDLAQYFFALGRLTTDGPNYDLAHRPAWLAFLREALRKAKSAGLDVGVCGEAAGDSNLTGFWLDAGVDTLSVAPGLVPWLKSQLRTGNSL